MKAFELCALLQRCRADEPAGWQDFADWVKVRGRTVLGGVGKLSTHDREDVIAEATRSLVSAIRRGGIRGKSDGEIDAYVCAAIRNRALNVARGLARRRDAGELTSGRSAADPRAGLTGPEARDETSPPDLQAIAAELRGRAEKLLMRWRPEDRYLFIAKLHGVSAECIRQTLEEPPYERSAAASTIDSRFHRLRKHLMEHLGEP